MHSRKQTCEWVSVIVSGRLLVLLRGNKLRLLVSFLVRRATGSVSSMCGPIQVGDRLRQTIGVLWSWQKLRVVNRLSLLAVLPVFSRR
jgi:hypothetical protein